ncbi:MAG: hypothetical protein LRZ88_13895 [Candidatus Cloacimonetes bacterium]|nr:hypothetical protein [Candidatus Cloacimonadota bacterium]
MISPTLFGTLLHAYFAEVLGDQASKHHNAASLDLVFADPEKLKTALLELINHPQFRYKMPKNYNADYMNSIICDCLAPFSEGVLCEVPAPKLERRILHFDPGK